MKKSFRIALWSVAAFLLGLGACTPNPDEPVNEIIKNPIEDAALSVKVNSVGISNVKGSITTEILNEVAYIIATSADAKEQTAEDIFEVGTLIELECDEDGFAATRFSIEELEENTEYVVYVAGRLNVKEGETEKTHLFEEVASATFTTSIRPTMNAVLIDGSETYNSAKLKITTANISRLGYMIYNVTEIAEGFTAPTPAIIFAEGILMEDLANGDSELHITRLAANSEYVVYIAGELAETQDFYEDVLLVEGIKTADFDEVIRVYDIGYNSFKVDVKAPANLVELDHVIKWVTSDLYTYNTNVLYGSGSFDEPRSKSTAEVLNLNDNYYGNYFNKSTTLTIDAEHSYKYYGNGEDDVVQYYDEMVPGQPQVVLLGEFGWGEPYGFSWGSGAENYGYYDAMFDYEYFIACLNSANSVEKLLDYAQNQGQFWKEGAFYNKLDVQLQKPEVLNKKINTTIESRPDGAAVIIEPEEGIDNLIVFITNNEIESVLTNVLGGKATYDEHIQWFVTSRPGALEGATRFTREKKFPEGVLRLELTDFFYEFAISRDDTYRAHIVALADDDIQDDFMDGHIQKYEVHEFQLKEATEPAPTFELNFVPEKTTATKAVFNLRSTNPSSNVTKAYYVANSERAWHQINGSCQALLDSYGQPLEGTDVDKINSAKGLDIEVPAIPNERIYMAVKISNIDGTRVYSEEAVISDVIINEPSTTDLTALNALAGDWTATATISYNEKQVDENGNFILDANGNNVTKPKEEEVKTKITIGGELTYPETLPESVYQIYEEAKVSREKTDAYFADFKIAADGFNTNLRNHNQILCKGWGFDTTGYINSKYADAYELFASEDYQGAYSVAPIYDFGPKWYIETDGTNFWVPFNTNYYVPMSSWTLTKTSMGYYWNEYHLIGNSGKSTIGHGGIDTNFQENETGYYKDGRFPIEISADGNTITIKPADIEVIKYGVDENGNRYETGREMQTFYPCAGHNSNNDNTYYFASRIVSDIVLTRGYTETPAVAKASVRKNNRIAKSSLITPQEIKTVERMKPLTPFVGSGVVTHEYPILSIDEFHRRNIEYLNSLKGIK